MITATVDASALTARLNGTAAKVFGQLQIEMVRQTGMLAEYIKREKLSGQVLKNRTGNLRNSVFPTVGGEGSRIIGTVAVDSTAPYGRYQEYGAEIPERVPVKAKALRWYGGGGSPIFAMRARAFTLQARPFMRPSLDEKAADISAGLQASINEAIK